MNIRTLIFNAATVALILAPAITLAGQDPVNGYYDSTEDWFVFEWVNPEHGKQRTTFDPGNKIKPSIRATVNLDASGETYTYSFRVTNETGARQLLQHIFIGHLAPVFGATAPEPQKEWDPAEYAKTKMWSWAKVLGATRGIPPGQSADGFSFKSKGLPAIVDAKFAGKRRAEFSPPGDEDSFEVAKTFEEARARLKNQYAEKFKLNVKLKTIGPIDPPAFSAASAIQNLIALVNQSKAQGWVTNDGIVTSLLAKLNNAASKVDSDKPTAKNTLNAFMNEVKAQNGKHLTAEAYALLYFNAKYLADRL